MQRITPKILALALLAYIPAAQQTHANNNQNHTIGVRTQQYVPTRDGAFVCTNGINRYTRALYGGPTQWRLETSDWPIFGAFHKQDNCNISMAVTVNNRTVNLEDAESCTSTYRGGYRKYELSDPSWKKGTVTITAVALRDEEGAIWRIEAHDMPKGAVITVAVYPTVEVKLSRNGDMGADPANCFDRRTDTAPLSECTIGIAGKDQEKFVKYIDRKVVSDDQTLLAAQYASAMKQQQELADRIKIDTPDPYINALAPVLNHAGDGIWDGTSYQHGAIGWRMPLNGWRGAYTGDFLGWHDRARTHFDAYAASQVTDVPATIPHPNQDPEKNMARAEKKWGTQMYSNGYICRNPNRKDQMHHYDMNLCYIDELLWHLKWTGDKEYARKMWPTIKASLEWEKRNFDPDDDGLYDAYCCIWASDALYYDGGAVTHSSAYNHRANKVAAEIAAWIGEDPTPYVRDAQKIYDAVNKQLWLDDLGVWAEYRDMTGNGLVHDHPGLWTVYHAIDGDLATPQQAYSATRYIDNNIPHIPVNARGIDGNYAVLSTTDWMPYTWSINNVAFAENYNAALAYWQAGRPNEAFTLLKSNVIDGMSLGNSPGNVGQISYYDAARGECYRDFADPIGVLSRAVVQGLFGYTPDAIARKATIRPGWPRDWDRASISHPDFTIDFKRTENGDSYTITNNIENIDSIDLLIPAYREMVGGVTVNGESANLGIDPNSVGMPILVVKAPANDTIHLNIKWDGSFIAKYQAVPATNNEIYRNISQGDFTWFVETNAPRGSHSVPSPLGVEMVAGTDKQPIDISGILNANITDIFSNQYLSPRPPYTTLQIPIQGIGDWCHPDMTANIDDSWLRQEGEIKVAGVPFKTAKERKNIAYVSMFDNYPTSIELPLEGSAKAISLLMAGSTNHMQCYVENAQIEVQYADGTTELLRLVPPYNWAPIEQDYYTDGAAFNIPTPRQYRVALADGTMSTRISDTKGIKGTERIIDGGAANILSIPTDPNKELKKLTLKAVANDVVVGLIAATYVR